MTAVLIQSLIFVGIYGILALSLNFQYGLTGILNFGQVIFFGVGAYSVAVVANHGGPDWLGVVAALICGGITALVIALPSARLTQTFWALVSLGAASLFVAVMTNNEALAGGAQGVYGITAWSSTTLLVVAAVLVVIGVACTERIRRSQFGRIIRSVREDPVLMSAMGRSAPRVTVVVCVLSGAYGALAGVLYAHWITYVSPDAFGLSVTLALFTMVILGGSGNSYGVLVGVAFVEAVRVALQYLPLNLAGGDLAIIEQLVNGGILVVFLLFLNRGLVPERVRRYSLATH